MKERGEDCIAHGISVSSAASYGIAVVVGELVDDTLSQLAMTRATKSHPRLLLLLGQVPQRSVHSFLYMIHAFFFCDWDAIVHIQVAQALVRTRVTVGEHSRVSEVVLLHGA